MATMTNDFQNSVIEEFPFYRQKKILVCGGDGFIGSHLTNLLIQSDANIVVVGRSEKCKNVNLSNNLEYVKANLLELNECKKIVKDFDYVFNVAGTTGGIDWQLQNSKELFFENSLLNLNLLLSIAESNVKRYQFLSSVVAYPKNAESPLTESTILDFENYNNNVGYEHAKILGEMQCKLFAEEFAMKISVIRSDNAYGPNDNFSSSSRVIPSLIKKVLESNTTVQVWGSGKQIRTFIFVKDLARGLLLGLEKHPYPDPINISSNEKITIKSLVGLIMKLANKDLKVVFDSKKPEGTLERILKISKAKNLLGFLPKWNLNDGLVDTLAWYKNHFGYV